MIVDFRGGNRKLAEAACSFWANEQICFLVILGPIEENQVGFPTISTSVLSQKATLT